MGMGRCELCLHHHLAIQGVQHPPADPFVPELASKKKEGRKREKEEREGKRVHRGRGRGM